MKERSTPRVHLVDVLRLVALLQMVNGHTLDAVMAPDVRDASWFPTYNFFRGLVSVAFMIASGVAFHLTRVSRLPETGPLVDDPAATRTRVRRMLELIAIGYLLRLPLGALSDDSAVVARSLAYFFQVDVLQCIGVSLLVLEGLSRALVRPGRVRAAALVLSLSIIALAPVFEPLGGGTFAALTDWVSHAGGSPFPVVPWGAYVMLGTVLGGVVWPEAGRTPARRVAVALGGATAVLSALSWVVWRSPVSLWTDSASYHSMPAFFVEKLAWVLGILACLAPLLGRVRRLPAPLEALAQRTLAIYVFHLVVLFFPPLMIATAIGPTLPLWQAFLVSGGMMVASIAFGLAWDRFRSRRAAPVPETAAPAPAT